MPSYRLGDMADSGSGGRAPDGLHVAMVKSFDAAQSQKDDPQIKVVSNLLDLNGRQHTWYYTLTNAAVFSLAKALVKLGVNEDYDMGPPGLHYVELFRPGFVGKALNIMLETKDRFQDTTVLGVAQLGPDGRPINPLAGPAGFPTATSPTGPAFGAPADNVPVPVQPAGPVFAPPMTHGNAQPVSVGVTPEQPRGPFG